jgi:hypothetical protein
VDWNPANLALEGPRMSIGIAGAAVDLHNNAFSLDHYNEVSGGTLSEADKNRILTEIPTDGLRVHADVRASALGWQYGSFALTFQGLGGASGRMDRDFFELVLMGNEIGQSVSFTKTEGEGYATAAATLSGAFPILTNYSSRLSAGANVRYLRGIYEAHIEDAGGSLVTTLAEIEGGAHASLVSATDGNGYGMDLGFTLQAPRGWVFGLVVDNLISQMRWTGDPERRTWSIMADTLNITSEDLDAAVVDQDTTVTIAPYRTRLPRRLRLGASNHWGNFLVAVDVVQGLESRAGVHTRPLLNTGLQYDKLSWLQPRCGLSFGGIYGSAAAIGVGVKLGAWRLDLAALNRGRILPNDTRGLGLAAGTSLEF